MYKIWFWAHQEGRLWQKSELGFYIWSVACERCLFVLCVQVAGPLQTPQIPVTVRRGASSAAEQPAGESPCLSHHHTWRKSRAPHELHCQCAGMPSVQLYKTDIHAKVTVFIEMERKVFSNMQLYFVQNFYKEKKREDIYIRWVGCKYSKHLH